MIQSSNQNPLRTNPRRSTRQHQGSGPENGPTPPAMGRVRAGGHSAEVDIPQPPTISFGTNQEASNTANDVLSPSVFDPVDTPSTPQNERPSGVSVEGGWVSGGPPESTRNSSSLVDLGCLPFSYTSGREGEMKRRHGRGRHRQS